MTKSKMTIAVVASLIGAALLSGAAHAQSFNCGPYLKRQQAPETVICQSPQLQALDEAMASTYQDIMDRLPGAAANRLRQNQISWLGARNSCGFNANCLVGRYNARIRDLNNY